MSMSDNSITVNGKRVPMTSGDINGLLAEHDIELDRGGVAVAINGEVVPRAEWGQTSIKPGDRIEIVQIVRGG